MIKMLNIILGAICLVAAFLIWTNPENADSNTLIVGVVFLFLGTLFITKEDMKL